MRETLPEQIATLHTYMPVLISKSCLLFCYLQMFNENYLISDNIWQRDCQNLIHSGAYRVFFWSGSFSAVYARVSCPLVSSPSTSVCGGVQQLTVEAPNNYCSHFANICMINFPDVCIFNHEYKQLFISNKWGGTLKGKIIHFYEVAAVEIHHFNRNFHVFFFWGKMRI